MNDDGKARRERIVEKVLIQENRTKLVLNFYITRDVCFPLRTILS